VTPNTDRVVASRHDVEHVDYCGVALQRDRIPDPPISRPGAMTMSKTRMRIAAICQIMLALGGATAAHAAQATGPCRQIVAACLEAGFTQGGARTGDGIQVDCVRPIMLGTAQPPRATRPLPQIDPQIVAACKARNPDFGQRNAPPAGAAPPNPPPPARTEPTPLPVPPPHAGEGKSIYPPPLAARGSTHFSAAY